jgi:hypothetical protein
MSLRNLECVGHRLYRAYRKVRCNLLSRQIHDAGL